MGNRSDLKLFTGNFTKNDLPKGIIQDIFQYWLDMKGGKPMPSRANLHPEDIPELLPHLALIDVESETKRYKYRLMGSETVRALGTDPTGRYLDEVPKIERLLKKNYDWLVRERRPYFVYDKLKWSEKSFMDYYALGLPLSQNGVDVDILMFGLFYQFPQ